MGPIDYSGGLAQAAQNPLQSFMQGLQSGNAMLAQQQQAQQQQAALEAQQRRQQLLAGLASKPNATADDYAAVMTQLPDLAEHLQKAWATKNTAQQQALSSDLLQWGAAIKSGKQDIASRQMTERADAMERAAGGQTRESQALRTQARIIADHPEFGLGQIQAMLAANPNGKDAAETLAKFGTEQRAADLHPSAVRQAAATADKAESDAKTAGVTAKYAEQGALLDLEKKGWDIKKIKADIDISREANRIAAMNAATAREGNALKRQELGLKIQEAQQKLDDKVREKVAAAESGATSIDNMLNTIERIKKNPRLDDVVGGLEGRMPGVRDDSVDAIALIETLVSQAFLAQIPSIKGMGALSDAEGKKLQAALTNLGRTQSEKQFRANLDEAARILNKSRESLSRSTGVPLGKPDTPAAPGSRPPLDSFYKQ